MIHEIAPHIFNNEFKVVDPKVTDFVIRYNGSTTLLKKAGEGYVIPQVGELLTLEGKTLADFEGHYLFSIDDTSFFLDDSKATIEAEAPEGYEYMGNRTFRGMNPVERMGGATAAHIAHWESLNKFCGKCGNVTIRGDHERSIICPKCGNVVYPRISPVVIVAVRNGDKLLMAHNIDNPNPRLFLISGFVEVGESLEQAVHREVMEEAGIRVKNIRYYKSQPWGIAQDVLAGFFCDVEGDRQIRMDENELKLAQWRTRDEIELQPDSFSLTNEMMKVFKEGGVV